MTGRRQPLISSFRAKREIFVIRGQMVNVWNSQTGNLLPANFRASPYLYFAALLYFYAPYHHFSFLISHSHEAFKLNQRTVRLTG